MSFHFIFVTNFIRDKNPLYGNDFRTHLIKVKVAARVAAIYTLVYATNCDINVIPFWALSINKKINKKNSHATYS